MKSVRAAVFLALIAAPAIAQEPRAWSVETPKESEAWLRYGVPGTEDRQLAFACVRKSGQVQVGATVSRQMAAGRDSSGAWVDRAGIRAPWPLSVAVSSESATTTLRGQARPDQTEGGTTVLTEVSTRAPVVAEFRKTGIVVLTAAGETIQPPPAPKRGYKALYRQTVTQAPEGCDFDFLTGTDG